MCVCALEPVRSIACVGWMSVGHGTVLQLFRDFYTTVCVVVSLYNVTICACITFCSTCYLLSTRCSIRMKAHYLFYAHSICRRYFNYFGSCFGCHVRQSWSAYRRTTGKQTVLQQTRLRRDTGRPSLGSHTLEDCVYVPDSVIMIT